jgi:hypothetical protein
MSFPEKTNKEILSSIEELPHTVNKRRTLLLYIDLYVILGV